jgi:hypothetical protein
MIYHHLRDYSICSIHVSFFFFDAKYHGGVPHGFKTFYKKGTTKLQARYLQSQGEERKRERAIQSRKNYTNYQNRKWR